MKKKKLVVSLAFFCQSFFIRVITGLTHLDNVFIGHRLVGFVVLGIFEKYLVHVRAGVLVKFVARAEDYKGYLAVAEDGKLVSLFHHSEFTFVERYLIIWAFFFLLMDDWVFAIWVFEEGWWLLRFGERKLLDRKFALPVDFVRL